MESLGLWDVLAALDTPAALVDPGLVDETGTTTPPPGKSPDRLVEPSTPQKRALAAAEDPDLDALDPAEAKRVKRMRRNRESAAMSRERKKQYIEELETKLAALTATVQQLRAENVALRAGDAPVDGSNAVSLDQLTAEQLPPLVPQRDDSESDTNSSLDAFLSEPATDMSLPEQPAALFGDSIGEKSGQDLDIFKIMGSDEVLKQKEGGKPQKDEVLRAGG